MEPTAAEQTSLGIQATAQLRLLQLSWVSATSTLSALTCPFAAVPGGTEQVGVDILVPLLWYCGYTGLQLTKPTPAALRYGYELRTPVVWVSGSPSEPEQRDKLTLTSL